MSHQFNSADFVNGAALALVQIFVSYYLSMAINETTLLLHLFQFFRKDLKETYTLDDFHTWAVLNMPSLLSTWISCSICQFPYLLGITVFVLWGVGLGTGHALIISTAIAGLAGLQIIRKTKVKSSEFKHDYDAMIATPKAKVVSIPVKISNDSTTDGAVNYREYAEHFKLRLVEQDGTVALDVSSLSDRLKAILPFFTDTTPCWFDGCEEMRAQYKANLEKLEAEAASGNCAFGANCQKGGLIRKYSILIDRKLHANQLSISNTRSNELP